MRCGALGQSTHKNNIALEPAVKKELFSEKDLAKDDENNLGKVYLEKDGVFVESQFHPRSKMHPISVA